jgi:hypothetical protein
MIDAARQQKLVIETIKGRIRSRIYGILKVYPDTRPRAKKAYKMLYWRYTRMYGVFPESHMPTAKFAQWLESPNEQSLGRIKRFVLKEHPELLEGMNPEPQERAKVNEDTSRRFYAYGGSQ